ncbi:MAG: hypothetical protein FJ304_19035 [Planctomycetes bacterium]|nr:hypothetical protein [Planctomycetota bacterium]
MAVVLRRFVVVQALLLWQGGFVFYAAVVVPVGTHLLGAASQGAVTARVTVALNALGVAALAALALDLRAGGGRARWACWGFATLCHTLLFALHAALRARLGDATSPAFYELHRAYLLASTVQWLAVAVLTALTLRAWRAADRSCS